MDRTHAIKLLEIILRDLKVGLYDEQLAASIHRVDEHIREVRLLQSVQLPYKSKRFNKIAN